MKSAKGKQQSGEEVGPFTFYMMHQAQSSECANGSETEGVSVGDVPPTSRGDLPPTSRGDLPPASRDQRWLHGALSVKRIAEVADPVLLHNGDFLVHASHVSGEYMLSAMCTVPLHVTLVTDASGKLVANNTSFDSITHLVTHFMDTGEPLHYNQR